VVLAHDCLLGHRSHVSVCTPSTAFHRVEAPATATRRMLGHDRLVSVISQSSCPQCSDVRLTMMVQIDSGRVFAESEGCHIGFWAPSLDDPFTTKDLSWERRRATLDEARAAGWERLVTLGQMPADDHPAPGDVAPFYVLDRVPLERVPWWAAEWLAERYDGDRLRELAGEHGDDGYKVKDLLPLVLDEMGIAVPGLVTAANRSFTYLARRCPAGTLSERDVAAMVDHIVAAGGFDAALYELPLAGIYGLDDEWVGGWGRTEDALRLDVQQACQQQIL
jgi:hypothetical protein